MKTKTTKTTKAKTKPSPTKNPKCGTGDRPGRRELFARIQRLDSDVGAFGRDLDALLEDVVGCDVRPVAGAAGLKGGW